MQTFLPYPSLRRSVEALDNRRLGKQRSETKIILKCLYGVYTTRAWQNHPAVRMWRGYEYALTAYYNLCIQEWVRRGNKNNMLRAAISDPLTKDLLPPWFGGAIHASHRAALLYKAAVREFNTGYDDELGWYSQFGWRETINSAEVIAGGSFRHYYWPR